MFEKYTERARRILFFARYEASQIGGRTIESEHLLLAILREHGSLMRRFGSAETIEADVKAQLTIREKVPASIDLPLSAECKRVLAFAAEEMTRLNQQHLAGEHMVLGILREEGCVAAQVLRRNGLTADGVRQNLAESPVESEPRQPPAEMRPLMSFMEHHPSLPKGGVVVDDEIAKRIALAVWSPIYGAAAPQDLKDCRAELKFDVWLVTGPESAEGTLYVYLSKRDGRVLSVGRGPAG